MKRMSCMILCAVLALLLVPFGCARADGAPWSGSGTKNDPYVITTRAELASLHDYIAAGNETIGKYFALGNDIDLTSIGSFLPGQVGIFEDWTPISWAIPPARAF